MHVSIYFQILTILFIIINPSFAYKEVGCFAANAIENLSFKNSYVYQSSGHCEEQCLGSYVIAVTNGDECYCGDNIDTTVSVDSNLCSSSCVGYPQENCGGNGYFRVIVDNSMQPDGTYTAETDISSLSSLESSSSSELSSSSESSSSETSTSSSTNSSTSSSSSSSSSESTSTTSNSSTSETPTTTSTTTSSSSTSSSSTSSSSTSLSTSSSSSTSTSTSKTSSISLLLTTRDTSATFQETEITKTSILSSIIVATSIISSQQSLVTIVQSVTSVSIEVKTATAVLTATLAPSASNLSSLTSASNRKSTSGISHGAIAGIVVGVVCGTILLTLLILWLFGVNLFCISGRNRKRDDYDNEKSIRDDSISLHNGNHLNHNIGLTGFGRNPALYNTDDLSIGYGTRRFSEGSLPDAAGGSESDTSNKRGLRVINPDLSDDER